MLGLKLNHVGKKGPLQIQVSLSTALSYRHIDVWSVNFCRKIQMWIFMTKYLSWVMVRSFTTLHWYESTFAIVFLTVPTPYTGGASRSAESQMILTLLDSVYFTTTCQWYSHDWLRYSYQWHGDEQAQLNTKWYATNVRCFCFSHFIPHFPGHVITYPSWD